MQSIFRPASAGPRYLVCLTLAITLGIYLGFHLPSSTDFNLLFLGFSGLLVGLLVCCVALLILRKPLRKYLHAIVFSWFLILTLFLGIFRVYCYDILQYKDLKETAGTSHLYTAVLIDNPTLSNTGKSYGFPVRVLTATGENAIQKKVSGSMMLYAPTEVSETLTQGDVVTFTATLHHPDPASFSGGFSLKEYLYRQDYLFQQYTKLVTKSDQVYQPNLMDRLRFLGGKARHSILESIDKSLGKNTEETALAKGILLGATEDFTEEQYQHFVDSGLVHITSVSGMHVVFLSAFLLFLFRLLFPNSLAQLILIPFLIVFAAIASFTPSVCRSTIMMILFALGQTIRREADPLTSLSAAGLVLLMINPYTLTSYSFILSFSSTIGIILFTSIFFRYLSMPFRRNPEDKAARRKQKSFPRRYLLEPVLSSLALSGGSLLGMGFFGMRFFRRITLGGFPANLCLLPFSAATFVLALLNWPITIFFPTLGNLIATGPLQAMLKCINYVAHIFSHPIFRIETPTPPASAFLPYLVFCIAIYFTLNYDSENNA